MRLSIRLSMRLSVRLSVRLSMRLSISFFITSRLKTLFSIDYWPFESFEVFERLEVIHGQHGLWRNVAALFLANNDANSETETPKMKEFGLKSLKSIENGNVIIMANEFKDSCHVTTIDWTKEDFGKVTLQFRIRNMFENIIYWL